MACRSQSRSSTIGGGRGRFRAARCRVAGCYREGRGRVYLANGGVVPATHQPSALKTSAQVLSSSFASNDSDQLSIY
jgi:hypothetical protein